MSEPGPMNRVAETLRRRRYEHPPVVEAVARFHWTTPVPWSFTTPGVLYEQFRAAYPEEPRAQAVIQAGLLAANEVPDGLNAGFQMSAGPHRILFSADDGSRLLGVSPVDLSVHGLPPYEGWESLEERLTLAVERMAIHLGEPPTIDSIGLRYINRVEIPEPAVTFEEYLTIGLSYPPGYPPAITGFLDRVEMEYPGEDVKLAFTWASNDATDTSVSFILDLDLIATRSSVTIDEAFRVLADLKVKEGQAFEALLTDRLRELFVEVVD